MAIILFVFCANVEWKESVLDINLKPVCDCISRQFDTSDAVELWICDNVSVDDVAIQCGQKR